MQAIVAVLVISIPLAVAGILFAPQMLRLIQAPASVVEVGSSYAAVLFGSNGILLLLFLINGIFRGAGDAVLALKALVLANVLNIALDPLLFFWLGTGAGDGGYGCCRRNVDRPRHWSGIPALPALRRRRANSTAAVHGPDLVADHAAFHQPFGSSDAADVYLYCELDGDLCLHWRLW